MQNSIMCIIVQCTVQSLLSILYIKSAAAADAISMLDMRPPVLLLLVGSRPTSPALKHLSKIQNLHFNHEYNTPVLDMRGGGWFQIDLSATKHTSKWWPILQYECFSGKARAVLPLFLTSVQ